MPEFITIAAAADLKSGERIVVEVKDHYIAVFNVGGTYYAIEDICTHDDGPLAEGELTEYVIECPRHGAQFDIRSGKNLSLIAPRPVARYEVRVENGQVQIAV
ncbi:MAG TPA: non-heme iron oxygenase ferredoxin subunit [Aggregatilineales bacterium]|nr:non-heme iron oxygenase ferredoxin subunit [Anaerolineales bacterium]HRE49533.1 non-heme iron oxygenase ferredoxin subunit [Aggregatilineales bacterium]